MKARRRRFGSIPVLVVRQGSRDNHAAVPAGGVLLLRGGGYTRGRLAESSIRLDRGTNRESQTGICPDAQGLRRIEVQILKRICRVFPTHVGVKN